MLRNKGKVLEIVLKLNNPFDYKEYKGWELDPLSRWEYAQKVGMLTCAMVEFPNEEPVEAYLKFIDNMNQEFDSEAPEQSRAECGSCGDKKRRVR